MLTESTSSGTVDRPSSISVVYVDDYAEMCELTASRLEDAAGRLDVTATTDPSSVVDSLGAVDCIVSDYEMPEMNGIELLRRVRALDDELPFILFTSDGSERVAGDALALGATDYLIKRGSAERFQRLAHRIERAVEAHRASRAVERTRERATAAVERERARFRALTERSPAAVAVLDADGTIQYCSSSIENVTGHTPRELVDESAFEYIHENDRERILLEFQRGLEDPSYRPTVEYRFRSASGEWLHVESRGVNQLDDPVVGGFIVNTRDVTSWRRTERRLRRERNLTERILQVSPNPLLVIGADGTVRRANDRAAALFGLDRSELVGLDPSHPSVTFHAKDGSAVEVDAYLRSRIIEPDASVRGVECTVELPSGRFDLVVSAAPLVTDTGAYAVVSIDEIGTDNNT